MKLFCSRRAQCQKATSDVGHLEPHNLYPKYSSFKNSTNFLFWVYIYSTNTTDEAPHQQVLTFCWAQSQHSWLWLSTHSWKIISVKPHLLPSLSSPINIHDHEPNGERTVHNLSLMHDIQVIQNFSTLLHNTVEVGYLFTKQMVSLPTRYGFM